MPLAVFAQSSAVPGLISYQGRLADASGVPLGTATPVNRLVVFRLWDDATATGAANRLYSEQQTVTISAGDFNALIGNGTPVAGETANAFATLSAAAFGGANRVLVALTVREGDIFTPEFFKELKLATDEVTFLPAVDRPQVQSLFTPTSATSR